MRIAVLVVSLALASYGALGAEALQRRALVIGNERYADNPLRNPGNDARRMATVLQEVGFQVTPVFDADLRTLGAAVDRFVASLGVDDIALVYYSGHGEQIDGENYLLPVDLKAEDEMDVTYGAYSAQRLMAKIESRKVRLTIVILDACRSNPYRGLRGGTEGLAQMSVGRGTFIAFAAAPGKTASDSPRAKSSIFTGYLVEALSRPGQSLDEVFNEVRRQVYEASGQSQLPWVSSSVLGSFYFRPAQAPPEHSEGLASASGREPAVNRAPVSENRARLGVGFSPFTPEYGRKHDLPPLEGGVVIAGLLRNGPAAKAGLENGDVVTRIDGTPASSANISELMAAIGPEVQIEAWRGRKRLDLRVFSMDGVPMLQNACAYGEGEGCWSAGGMYVRGELVTKNLPLAAAYFERGCELDSAGACGALALAYETGSGVSQNPATAAGWRQKACAGGHFSSCTKLGNDFLTGKGITRDVPRAAAYFNQACNGGDAGGCYGLALMKADGTDKDPRGIARLLRKACDGGLAEACAKLPRDGAAGTP